MEALSDLSSIIRVLRKGIRDGRWTLEDLDKPSRGFELAKKEYLTRNPLSNGQWKVGRNGMNFQINELS